MQKLGMEAIGITLGALFIAPVILAQSTYTPPANHLVFLGNKSLPPMVYLDGNKPKGIAVDIVNAISEEMGRHIDIRLMDWSEAQSLLARGGADALIHINKADSRTSTLDFSDPLVESRFRIFTTNTRAPISGEEDLRGMTVGVEPSSFPELLLQKDRLIHLNQIPTVRDGFILLRKGQIDAVVADQWVGQYILAKEGIEDVHMVGEPVAVTNSSIAVKKGNTDLLAAINAGLAKLRQDGTYQAILDKWVPQNVLYRTREQMQLQLLVLASVIGLIVILSLTVIAIVQARRLEAERQYRHQIEEKERTIAEKELILKEVHHRIKNNMSNVVGLLSIQASREDSPKVKESLEEASERIMSMMVLYDRLYHTSSYETSSLDGYLTQLTAEILSNFSNSEDVLVAMHVEAIELGTKQLYNIGIIVNELITNIMKYAFRGIERPEITIETTAAGDDVRLSVSDNGIGMPTSSEPSGHSGFGLTLVEELTKQIGGSLHFSTGEGTTVTLAFKRK